QKIRYVVGDVKEPLNLEEGEKVIFAGDCTRWEGEIDGEAVCIAKKYQRSDAENKNETKSGDMISKFLSSTWHCFRNRSSRYVQAKGCPISVAEHVNYLASFAGIGNPNLDPRLVIPANIAYWQMRFHRFLNRYIT
ncbi:MAG: hypothetical protein V3S66_00655, partial [Desulfobacterales bacterium]